ncbi:MAG: class I SAM-dependent methyltransferase [Rhizobiaceae bacterium]|nr:class I SAM-dependent methyltransferase [Rhizobiaceae bacterium]
MTDDDLSRLASRTQAVYERNAQRFDAERPKGLHERLWLDRFLDGLPPGGKILDLGCGAGMPIAAYFMGKGFAVTGLDASAAMIQLAKSVMPDGDWREGDMRGLDLNETFDGIIGWNSFFHLTRPEQRDVLPRLARHLETNGRLMLTVGPENGEAVGQVGDDRIYHASLSPDEYASILLVNQLAIKDFVIEDPQCDFQTILLAQKTE